MFSVFFHEAKEVNSLKLRELTSFIYRILYLDVVLYELLFVNNTKHSNMLSV